jgi:deoxyribonuclease-4
MPRFGLHVSISSSVAHAAERAFDLGCDTFQIFSASPRMWRAPAIPANDALAMRQNRARFHLTPLVIHDNYLINLAAADEKVRRNSIAAFRGEVERADQIGADYLVAHPGSSVGQTVDSAIALFAGSLETATAGLQPQVTLLLECTAGQGSTLGRTLEELAQLKAAAASRTAIRIGFCLDTCHLFAAGYAIDTPDGLEDTLQAADRLLGLEHVPVLHTNDSKAPFASHRDRHEHIGKGSIGEAAFARLLQHPALQNKAFILETPEDENGDGASNLATLRRLACQSR